MEVGLFHLGGDLPNSSRDRLELILVSLDGSDRGIHYCFELGQSAEADTTSGKGSKI